MANAVNDQTADMSSSTIELVVLYKSYHGQLTEFKKTLADGYLTLKLREQQIADLKERIARVEGAKIHVESLIQDVESKLKMGSHGASR